jgi:hypothetical protein
MKFSSFVRISAALAFAACKMSDECGANTCYDAVDAKLARPISDPATYTFTIDVDGTSATCTKKLPQSGYPTAECDRADVWLVSTVIDGGTSALTNVMIKRAGAKAIDIRIAKDGVEIAHDTFAPVYDIEVHADGPSCGPVCHSADHTVAF